MEQEHARSPSGNNTADWWDQLESMKSVNRNKKTNKAAKQGKLNILKPFKMLPAVLKSSEVASFMISVPWTETGLGWWPTCGRRTQRMLHRNSGPH